MDIALPTLRPIEPARTCVWMDAGVVAFRLCDRGFACDECPFDACMRGVEPSADAAAAPDRAPAAAWAFPADRLYAPGHLWVQVVRDRRVRIGIDACAARALTAVREVRAEPAGSPLERSQRFCTLVVDGGELPIDAPIGGSVARWNDALAASPSLVATDPYGAGWLAELDVAARADLVALLRAPAAELRARGDAGHFRRQLALRLLASEPDARPEIDPLLVEVAARLLGPAPVVGLARSILH